MLKSYIASIQSTDEIQHIIIYLTLMISNLGILSSEHLSYRVRIDTPGSSPAIKIIDLFNVTG